MVLCRHIKLTIPKITVGSNMRRPYKRGLKDPIRRLQIRAYTYWRDRKIHGLCLYARCT